MSLFTTLFTDSKSGLGLVRTLMISLLISFSIAFFVFSVLKEARIRNESTALGGEKPILLEGVGVNKLTIDEKNKQKVSAILVEASPIDLFFKYQVISYLFFAIMGFGFLLAVIYFYERINDALNNYMTKAKLTRKLRRIYDSIFQISEKVEVLEGDSIILKNKVDELEQFTDSQKEIITYGNSDYGMIRYYAIRSMLILMILPKILLFSGLLRQKLAEMLRLTLQRRSYSNRPFMLFVLYILNFLFSSPDYSD